jgi:hypothetical protein
VASFDDIERKLCLASGMAGDVNTLRVDFLPEGVAVVI